MVGGHGVARRVVGLHEDGAGVQVVSGAGGRGRERRRRQGRHGQHADADGGHETTEYLHKVAPSVGKAWTGRSCAVQSPQGRKRYGQTVPERGTCSEIRYESTVLSTHELPWK